MNLHEVLAQQVHHRWDYLGNVHFESVLWPLFLGLSRTGVFILQFSWWLPLLWAIFCKVPGHFRSQYTTIIQPQLIKRAFSVTFSYLYVRPLSGTCASSGNLKKGLHVKHYVSFIVLYRNCSSLKNCKIELDIECIFGWWRQESGGFTGTAQTFDWAGSPPLQCWVTLL